MKVAFKYGISGFTGKVDGNSVYFHREARRFVVRRIPRFEENSQHSSFRSIQKNLWRIHPAEPYKADLRQYIAAFRQIKRAHQPRFLAWNNVWQLMMYELARTNPAVDLSTITRQEIYDQNLPCINVAAAVQAGLLYPVEGYEALINSI